MTSTYYWTAPSLEYFRVKSVLFLLEAEFWAFYHLNPKLCRFIMQHTFDILAYNIAFRNIHTFWHDNLDTFFQTIILVFGRTIGLFIGLRTIFLCLSLDSLFGFSNLFGFFVPGIFEPIVKKA